MVTLHSGKQIIIDNKRIASKEEAVAISQEEAFKNTLTYQVLKKHNHSDNMEHLQIQFDSMGVYDNTYVGILQTAYASGLKEFPMPCVFTNCHNCLCAVGGTINTDVHKYAESACKKSGGIFVPPHEAVIHQYMREMIVKSGICLLYLTPIPAMEHRDLYPSVKAARNWQRQCLESIMRSIIRK